MYMHIHARRDSKLTRFLQPALEGNALIAIICSISASVACLDETHNTLKVHPPVFFATKCMFIMTKLPTSHTTH